MADVEVDIDDATEGRLPALCVMTGASADGAIPIRLDRSLFRWGSPTVRIPMSKPAYRKWSVAQSVMVKVRILAMLLVLGALVLSARNPLMALVLLVAGGLAMAVSVRAERKVNEFQPSLTRRGRTLKMGGVHDDFARAVEQRS